MYAYIGEIITKGANTLENDELFKSELEKTDIDLLPIMVLLKEAMVHAKQYEQGMNICMYIFTHLCLYTYL